MDRNTARQKQKNRIAKGKNARKKQYEQRCYEDASIMVTNQVYSRTQLEDMGLNRNRIQKFADMGIIKKAPNGGWFRPYTPHPAKGVLDILDRLREENNG